MVQQLGNSKSDKTLTKNDLARVAYASGLNFFHTNTMFNPWPFGIYYAVNYVWVKRINSNSYQFQHCYVTTSAGLSPIETAITHKQLHRQLSKRKIQI